MYKKLKISRIIKRDTKNENKYRKKEEMNKTRLNKQDKTNNLNK